MIDFHKFPPKIPKTIDRLQIADCMEIIINDLARYGVPERLALKIVDDFYIPLKNTTDVIKSIYAEKCFKNTPDSSFEK